jgi:two-component system NarL family sensor kinase
LSIISLIIIGIFAMLLLAFGIIFFVVLYQRRIISHQEELKKITQQKELELIQASIQSAEDERARIASELHDDVGATLASARLFLYKAKDADYNESGINQSKDLLDESIYKIRDISHKLQPAILQHLGLQLALQSLIEVMDRSKKIQSRFVVKNPLPRTDEATELAAYRIAQEVINNIIKHAQATQINMDLDAGDGKITITFAHNGMGLTHEMYQQLVYKKGATGLKNIVNRLKAVNAGIQFYKEDEQWYKTTISLPVAGIRDNT